MAAVLSHDGPAYVPPSGEPGATRSRCTPRCASTTRSITSEARRLLGADPAPRRLRRRARPRDVLVGAGPDHAVRRAGAHRPGRQPADGDDGPAGAHRVPPAGVPRLHPAPGRVASSPPSARSWWSGWTGCARPAAATSSRALQAAAEHGRRALPRRPEEDRGRFDALDRRHRRGQRHRGVRRGRRCDRRADGLLRRADRAAPPRARGRHRLPLVAAGEAGDDAGMLRILAFTFTMVTGGNDTDDRPARRRACSCSASVPTSARSRLDDLDATVEELLRLTTSRAGPGPHDDPRRRRSTASRSRRAARCCSATARPTATRTCTGRRRGARRARATRGRS